MATEVSVRFRENFGMFDQNGNIAPNREHEGVATNTTPAQRAEVRPGMQDKIDLLHQVNAAIPGFENVPTQPPPAPKMSDMGYAGVQAANLMEDAAGALFQSVFGKPEESAAPQQPQLQANLQPRTPQGGPGVFGL